MATYYVDENGNITKKKKKQETTYSVDAGGNITVNKQEEEDIAPVKDTEKDERKWFEKGAFEDGYQFGDVAKTIWGSSMDLSENVTAGILGIGEAAVDAGAYLVGGASKLFGGDKFADKMQGFIEKDLYDEREVARKLLQSQQPLSYLFADPDDDSVLGDKTDSLAQSAGQLGGTIALQAAGVPWWLTTGVTSFGRETENAFKQDATYGEAGGSALISAGAEILSERLFGGISFGGKTLDDVLLQPLVGKISNKVVRTMLNLGLDAAGEGVEEIVSSVFSRLGSALYKEESIEELLTSEEAMDEYLESFIGGAVLGGGMGGFNAVRGAIDGVDYKTGRTESEQKVFEKEVENRIAEREQDGKKLTNKEKKAIEEAVKTDMERGYLSTDTIESVLGGDYYQMQQNYSQEADTLKAEIEQIESRLEGDVDATEQQRLRERLKQARAELKEHTDGIGQYKSNTSRFVTDALMGERRGRGSMLVESYNERARRGVAFEADMDKYTTKEQAVIQKAIDSGILNNTNRTHDFVDMIAKISAEKGVLFDFTNNAKLKVSGFAVEGKQVNGFVTKDGVTVNIDSAKSLNSVVGHEITHVLEGTELYGELQKAVMKYAEAKGELATRKNSLTQLYKGIKDANVDAELTADLVGDYLFTDADFIRNLSVEHRNVFQKIYDEVKYLIKVAKAGSKEARELERVKRAFDKAYKEGGKKQTDTKYSISPEQQAEYQNRATAAAEQFGTTSDIDRAGFVIPDGRMLNLSRYGGKGVQHRLIESVFDDAKGDDAINRFLQEGNVRLKASAPGMEIGEGIAPTTSQRNTMRKFISTSLSKNGIFYLDITGENGGEIASVTYDASETSASDIMYDIEKYYESGRIPKNNTRYSLTDSDGNQLTKEQGEYFKDSKVKDAKGNLLKMYHSSVEDFTVFDKNKIRRHDLDAPFNGFWFSNSENTSPAMRSGNYLKSGYLRIDNPAPRNVWRKVVKDVKNSDEFKFSESRSMHDEVRYRLQEMGYDGIHWDGVPEVDWDTLDRDGYVEFKDVRGYKYALQKTEYGYDLIDLHYDYGEVVTAYDDRADFESLQEEVWVAFESNQFKNEDNLNPTENPDIRFSLSESVEESDGLMALHNLKGDELLKSLELGGLPMPSLAVIKAQQGHEKYGEVSLIFPKDTIDPKSNKDNKIYGGDAWTPTYPRIEYKVREKAQEKIRDKYYEIANKHGYDLARPMYRYVSELESALNTEQGEANLLDWLYRDTKMMQVYLADSGKGAVEDIVKETRTEMSDSEKRKNQWFIDKLGEDVIRKFRTPEGESIPAHRRAFIAEHKSEIEDAWESLCRDVLQIAEENVQNIMRDTTDGMYARFIREAEQYLNDGGVTIKTETDYNATEIAIEEKAADGYKEWVDGLFKGVQEKTGIRNDKDTFTNTGNRRSWDALHWSNTLENVVRAMKTQDQTGADAFSPASAIFAVAHKRYNSIEEVKADSNRLGRVKEDEYKAMEEEYASRLAQIAKSIQNPNERNPFIAADEAAQLIVDAVRSYKSKAGMLRYMKEWNGRVTEATVDNILSLVNDIANMPTGYFEAKPQRAVSFDEVGVFVIPRNADVKLKQELLNRGYAIAEYDPDVEGDRQKVVNSFEEYKFSLSDVGVSPKQYGNYNVYGSDVGLETAPVARVQDAVQDSVDETVDNTVADDFAPMPSEPTLYELQAEQKALENEIRVAMESNDQENGVSLIERYNEVSEEIKRLEADESARLGSITDADAPPEMDAPYFEDNNSVEADNPFADRDIKEVGKRSVKAYMYENPEVKPFFQEEAGIMLGELRDTIKGERIYTPVEGGVPGEYGSDSYGFWTGVSRHTTPDIAYLLDELKYSYAEIEKGLKAIIEDNGKENNACSKRIEFLLNDRLMNGYQASDGFDIPANQEYVELLNAKQITEYNEDSFKSLFATAEEAPVEDIAPVNASEAIKPKPVKQPRMARATPEEQLRLAEDIAPTYETTNEKQVPGQRRMFADGHTAEVLDGEPPRTQKQSRLWSKFRNNFLDKQSVFEDLALKTNNRELMGKANYMLSSESRAQWMIGHGAKGVKSLNDIRAEVEKTGLSKQFAEYLYHVHNVDRMTLDVRFGTENKAVFGDSVTAEVSRAEVKKLEAQYPQFKRFAADVYAYNKHLRKQLVNSGVISQETADLWDKMYPHYVPIRRVGESGLGVNVPLDSRKTGVNAPIKRATGGSSDILPLFDTMAMRTEQTYKAIAKNRFGVELKNTLGTTVETGKASLDEVIDSIDAHEELLQKGKNGQNPTFTVFENGKRVTFEISEDMYDALKPTAEGLKTVIKPLSVASSIQRGLLTEYNPVFMLTNAVKDAQDVLINSQHPAKTYAKLPSAFKELATKGAWYNEYMANGGEQNTYFDGKSNTFAKEDSAIKKVVGMPLRAISAMNNFIERAPRLAEYMASREAGASAEVAMLDAARVTTNFQAGGDVTRWANRNGFTFLNASVQGFNQQVRNVREAKVNGLKGWAQLATKVAMAGLPAMLLNNLLWDDDEEYEELSDYVKQNYYVVAKYGDGKFVRIPKGRALAVIQNAFEQTTNALTGNDEVDLGSFLELVISNLAPNNPLDNNIIAPIMQAYNNETWYGEALVPQRLQDLPAAEQYDESTDSISKWLGEKLNVSPYKLNYLLNQYSGGAGDVVLPFLTPEAERGDSSIFAPFADKFTTDGVMNNQNVSDFYDTMDTLTANAKSIHATDEDLLKYKYFNTVNADLSELYQQKREIQSSNLSDADKYSQMRDIQEQINALARGSLATYGQVNIDGSYASIGDVHFRLTDKGEWQKVTDKQLEKQEEVTGGLGISASDYWSNKEEYDYAYESPEKYAVSQAVGGYDAWKSYSSELYDIKADKDEDGKSISGSRKEKVIAWINEQDMDYGAKLVLFKSEYPADDTYNADIVEYLNARDDITYEQMVTILKELGFKVNGNNVTWD